MGVQLDPQRSPAAWRAPPGRVWPWLLLLILVTVTFQLTYLPAPHWGDAQRVFRYAAWWPDVPSDHHAFRLGILLPTRAFIGLLGQGQVAFAASAIAFSCVLICGVFLAGRELFGTIAGFIAACLVLASPFLIDTATHSTAGQVLPDIPNGGFVALGVAATLRALRAPEDQQRAWLVLAGLAFGWSYLAREFAAGMFIVLPALVWARHASLRTLTPTVTTMAGIFAVEMIVNGLVHGHPLIRLTVASTHGGVLAEPLGRGEALLHLWSMARHQQPTGWFLLLGLGLLLVGSASRDRRFIVCLVWFLGLWIPLTLFGGLLDPVSPTLRAMLARYWIPVHAPIAIAGVGLCAVGLLWCRQRWGRQTSIAIAVLAIVAILPTYIVPNMVLASEQPDASHWAELRTWLDESQPDHVWTDNRTRDVLAFYRRSPFGQVIWDGDIEWYWIGHGNPPTDEMDGPIVQSKTSLPLPEHLEVESLFRSSNGQLEVVRLR